MNLEVDFESAVDFNSLSKTLLHSDIGCCREESMIFVYFFPVRRLLRGLDCPRAYFEV